MSKTMRLINEATKQVRDLMHTLLQIEPIPDHMTPDELATFIKLYVELRPVMAEYLDVIDQLMEGSKHH